MAEYKNENPLFSFYEKAAIANDDKAKAKALLKMSPMLMPHLKCGLWVTRVTRLPMMVLSNSHHKSHGNTFFTRTNPGGAPSPAGLVLV